jgi:hypothetical protein
MDNIPCFPRRKKGKYPYICPNVNNAIVFPDFKTPGRVFPGMENIPDHAQGAVTIGPRYSEAITQDKRRFLPFNNAAVHYLRPIPDHAYGAIRVTDIPDYRP